LLWSRPCRPVRSCRLKYTGSRGEPTRARSHQRGARHHKKRPLLSKWPVSENHPTPSGDGGDAETSRNDGRETSRSADAASRSGGSVRDGEPKSPVWPEPSESARLRSASKLRWRTEQKRERRAERPLRLLQSLTCAWYLLGGLSLEPMNHRTAYRVPMKFTKACS
jgi:hypothetical protein